MCFVCKIANKVTHTLVKKGEKWHFGEIQMMQCFAIFKMLRRKIKIFLFEEILTSVVGNFGHRVASLVDNIISNSCYGYELHAWRVPRHADSHRVCTDAQTYFTLSRDDEIKVFFVRREHPTKEAHDTKNKANALLFKCTASNSATCNERLFYCRSSKSELEWRRVKYCLCLKLCCYPVKVHAPNFGSALDCFGNELRRCSLVW